MFYFSAVPACCNFDHMFSLGSVQTNGTLPRTIRLFMGVSSPPTSFEFAGNCIGKDKRIFNQLKHVILRRYDVKTESVSVVWF